MFRVLSALIVLAFSTPLLATPVETLPVTPPVTTQPARGDVQPPVVEEANVLSPYSSFLSLTLGIPVPIQYGLGANYAFTDRQTIEASVLTGSLNAGVGQLSLGALDETQFTVVQRYYPSGGSFNLIVGLSLLNYRLHLGSSLLSDVVGPVGDLVKVDTLGLQMGLGNRFRFSPHFWLNVDWVVLNIPLTTLSTDYPALDQFTNASDRNRIDDALKFMRYIPTADVLKVNLGYEF